MPTFLNNPINVSNGTLFTSGLYNAHLGSEGTLQYLYESLSNYIGACGYSDDAAFIPTIAQYSRSSNQTISNAVNADVIFDNVQYGVEFWDGIGFDSETAGCYITNNAPVLILCSFVVWFATNSTGTRQGRISVTATNATVNRNVNFTRKIDLPSSTGFTGIVNICPVIITPDIGSGPSYNTPYFKVKLQAYQNSGGDLNMTYAMLSINKLPSC